MIEKLTAAPGCLVSDSAFTMKAEPSSNFHGLDGLRDDLSITFLVEASPVQVYFFSVVVVIEIHIRIRIQLFTTMRIRNRKSLESRNRNRN